MCRADRRIDRRGFTLVELAAALALVGFVLLGASLLLDQLRDAGSRITRATRADARQANGERLLRELLRDAEPTLDTLAQLRGDERSVDYGSWCDVPAGWRERCRVRLSVDSAVDSSLIILDLSTDEHLTLGRLAGSAELRYLDPARRDSVWAQQWPASAALPAAIAVVTGGDTLVFGVGPSRE